MMFKAGKGISLIARMWKNALITCVCAIAFATSANAYDLYDHNKNIKYVFNQNDIYDLGFPIAWNVMKPLYKGSLHDKSIDGFTNPLIAIGEAKLNNDALPEIISYPLETEEEAGDFCKAESLCPHYVLEVRGKSVHTLAIIYANSLDLGDQIKNGYRTLKAYTKEADKADPHYFETYAYDKNADKFMKTSSSEKQP